MPHSSPSGNLLETVPQPRGAPACRHHKRRQPLPTPRPDAKEHPKTTTHSQNRHKTENRHPHPRISQKRQKHHRKKISKPPPDSTPTPKSSSGRSTASNSPQRRHRSQPQQSPRPPQPHRLAPGTAISTTADSIKILEADLEAMRLAYAKALRELQPHAASTGELSFIFQQKLLEAYSRIRYLRRFSAWRERRAENIRRG